MLTIIDSKEVMSSAKAMAAYPGKKTLFLVDSEDDNELYGRVYALSNDISSFNEIYDLFHKTRKDGIDCIVLGDYREGDESIVYTIFN